MTVDIPPEACRNAAISRNRCGDAMDAFHVRAWRSGHETFEVHSGEPGALPKHFHPTYQIAITTRAPGQYVCDGKTWWAPPGSITVFHPGEVHSTQGTCIRKRDDASKLIYVEPGRLADIAASVRGTEPSPPTFDNRVIADTRFIQRFAHAHALSCTPASLLEKESSLFELLAALVENFATPSGRACQHEKNRIKAQRVRDYVVANVTENLGLTELAELVHTSPYHLNRLFSKEFGMPPHAFQTQVRVEQVKRLLLNGESVTSAAMSMGFYDQSHMARHFRRIVGVSPRTYAAAMKSNVSLQT